MSETKVKICGLTRAEDVDAVNMAKPDYAGFVFAGSRRRVTPEQAAVLRARLHPSIVPVGVFVNAPLAEIAAMVERGTIQMAQLHGGESWETIRALKAETGVPVIQAVRVDTRDDILRQLASPADYLLLDNGAGGTGQAFDWQLATACTRPFFLAGGVDLANIRKALALEAYCIDTSSGVETDGKKDAAKILAIVQAVRE